MRWICRKRELAAEGQHLVRKSRMGGDQRRMDSGQLAEPEHRLASCFCHLEGMCCDWQQSWLLTLAG